MNWVTYFPKLASVHFTKDLGLIPLYMQEVCGFQSRLVGQFPDLDREEVDDEAAKLQIVRLEEKGKLGFIDRAFMTFLREHASQIDVLNLFQLGRDNILYGLAYKYYNPQGKLYLKLDAYNQHLEERKIHARSPVKRGVLRVLEDRFFRKLNLVSVENKAGFDLARQAYPQWADKLIYLPNGANDRFLSRHFNPPFAKTNTVLSVGRPGSAVKNYELFLEALPFLERFPDWNYRIVGPITPAFAKEWEATKQQFPSIASRVEWLGEITDRLELYREFERAKVFFMPSRFESFGLVYAEALYFGCVLVGHQGMSAYADLCSEGRFGTYFQDNLAETLANAIGQAMEKSGAPTISEAIQEHSAVHFHWSAIVKTLNEALNER